MNKIYKKAFKSAKKELEKDFILKVKEAIKDTFQAMEDVKSDIAKLQAKLKVYKADLSDLENGKLKSIKSRQDKDKLAKSTSKVNIEKILGKEPKLSLTNTSSINTIGYCTTTGGCGGGGGAIDWKYVQEKFDKRQNDNMFYCNTTGNTTGLAVNVTNCSSTLNLSNIPEVAYSRNQIADTYIVKTDDGGEKAFYVNEGIR